VVLSTTTPARADDGRGVRTVDVHLRSDAAQLATLVSMVDAGDLRVDVGERLPLAQLPAVHARAVAGGLPGKVVLLPAA
jgi:NADPH:quinone reductase-like Zn-dependent oxidoreductase